MSNLRVDVVHDGTRILYSIAQRLRECLTKKESVLGATWHCPFVALVRCQARHGMSRRLARQTMLVVSASRSPRLSDSIHDALQVKIEIQRRRTPWAAMQTEPAATSPPCPGASRTYPEPCGRHAGNLARLAAVPGLDCTASSTCRRLHGAPHNQLITQAWVSWVQCNCRDTVERRAVGGGCGQDHG